MGHENSGTDLMLALASSGEAKSFPHAGLFLTPVSLRLGIVPESVPRYPVSCSCPEVSGQGRGEAWGSHHHFGP